MPYKKAYTGRKNKKKNNLLTRYDWHITYIRYYLPNDASEIDAFVVFLHFLTLHT